MAGPSVVDVSTRLAYETSETPTPLRVMGVLKVDVVAVGDEWSLENQTSSRTVDVKPRLNNDLFLMS